MSYGPSSSVARRPAPASGLPVTPSVALRRLWEQLDSYRTFIRNGERVDIFDHFQGPVSPPKRDRGRPVGDRVFEAVAEYASSVLARAGLLTTRNGIGERERLEQFGRLTRMLFTAEHALAIDLARTAPHLSLREREQAARATLSLAAYWCDRSELSGVNLVSAHPLLGSRPSDQPGQVLYDQAMASLEPPKRPSDGSGSGVSQDAGIGLGIAITSAA